jgi:hypothetical protein
VSSRQGMKESNRFRRAKPAMSVVGRAFPRSKRVF